MAKVVGIGAGAGMILKTLQRLDAGINCAAIGTNAKALEDCGLINSLLIGEDRLQGLGARGDMEKGGMAVRSSAAAIVEMIDAVDDLLILVACLGGGTGSAGIIEVTKLALKRNKRVLCVMSFPFSFEGPQRANNARMVVAELKQLSNIFVFANDRISAQFGHLSLHGALAEAKRQLATFAKDLIDIHAAAKARPADAQRFQSYMKKPGLCYASSDLLLNEEDYVEAASRILDSEQFPKSGLKGAKHAMIKVSVGPGGISHADITNLWTGLTENMGHEELLIGVSLNARPKSRSLTICAGGYNNGITA